MLTDRQKQTGWKLPVWLAYQCDRVHSLRPWCHGHEMISHVPVRRVNESKTMRNDYVHGKESKEPAVDDSRSYWHTTWHHKSMDQLDSRFLLFDFFGVWLYITSGCDVNVIYKLTSGHAPLQKRYLVSLVLVSFTKSTVKSTDITLTVKWNKFHTTKKIMYI